MYFLRLSEYFSKIESVSSRLAITHLLASLFKELDLEEAKPTAYLLQGRVVPLYERLEFGMGEKMVLRSIALALNLEMSYLKKEYKRIGDIGETTEKFKKEIISYDYKKLKILDVYNSLVELAKASGDGSQERKIKILANLIRSVDPLSARYLVRIPLGRLRLGFSDMTVLDALSWMTAGDKSLRKVIERAYHLRPDLGFLVFLVKKSGIGSLSDVKPTLFVPILMMRAERLSSAKEIVEKIGRCIIEPKFDGFRIQAHLKDGKARLFSRNLEDVTFMYPDIVKGIRKEIKAKELIIEGEAIGFDELTGNFLPFQQTVQRRRKYGIAEKIKEIPLKLFVFELLYLDGKDFTRHPFIERRKTLDNLIKSPDIFTSTILKTKEVITDDPKRIEMEFEEAVTEGLEGIVAKKMNGTYQPGARDWNWIKFKRSYSSQLEDTIDAIVMGYYYGKGKRNKFGIGAFLVGIYDEEEDKYKTIAKIGTGLTDEEWRRMAKMCEEVKSENKPALYDVDKQLFPDVWVEPTIVVEILADEITRSPVHTAGRVMRSSKSGQALEIDVPGFALRFPRLQRVRDDKRPEEVTTLTEVKQIYNELEKNKQ